MNDCGVAEKLLVINKISFMGRITVVLFIIFHSLTLMAQKNGNLVETILKNKKNLILEEVLNHPNNYRCQIIYVQINRDKYNKPHFTYYNYRNNPEEYFYPASTVKLPLAALSLQKLNDLDMTGVNKFTTIQFDSSYEKQSAAYFDSTAENGLPTIANYIKRAFLISENDPYNRMYQFVGQQTINRDLFNKGYDDIKIIRQFSGLNEDQNRHTNQVRFLDKNGRLIYTQPAAFNTDSFDFKRDIKIGKAYLNREDSLINEPFDFSRQNRIALQDLADILRSLIFPESVPEQKRFRLTKEDYQFLQQYLSQYPSETNYPKYDTTVFYDSYVKFFFRDSAHLTIPEYVRIFNKVGWSYGFLTDVSYIMDKKNKVEFMLAATIYANKDDILNDNKYDYEAIGHPFLYQLGQAIYEYELNRKYTRRPDLSDLIITYDHRDPFDKRPPLKEVDN